MQIFYRTLGQGEPVVILHGLYGCSDNWLTIAHRLSDAYRVVIPDMRNHGRSPHDAVHSYAAMRDDVVALIKDVADRPVALVGHSMGGKVAMHIALRHPELLSRLIIADIAPINYSSLTEPTPMALFHLNLLQTLLSTDLSTFTTLEDIREYWHARIDDEAICRFMLKNLQRADHGFRWRINLKAIADNLPEIVNGMDVFNDESQTVNTPTLFLRGEKSNYLPPSCFEFTCKHFTHAQISTIPATGHWLHAEQPDLVFEKMRIFLRQ